jgi:predicted transcriptional regulator
MDPIGEIRKRRLSLGISLGELARAIGRSDATVSRIERGKIRPSYQLVQQMLAFLEEKEGRASPHLTALDLLNTNLVTIDGNAMVAQAASLMERGGFSQLPVLEEGRVTGAVSETALLRALGNPEGRRARVRDVQEGAYPILDSAFPAELLPPLLTRYAAVLVAERGRLKGIVTRTDLIRGLRGTPLRKSSPPG